MELKKEIERAAVARLLVRIHREAIGDQAVDGYVVGMGPEFFAMEIISDGIAYDGFNCMRYSDVTSCEIPAPNHEFLERALKLKGCSCDSRYYVDLSSLDLLLESAASRYPLVTIHLEIEDPEVCYIGKFLGIADQHGAFRLLNSFAVWEDDTVEFELEKITRIDFGGDYEEALWLVANNPG